MSGTVLVLNANFEPIHVCSLQRAIGLIFSGRADMVANGRGFIHTASCSYPCPSVILLNRMVHRPRLHLKLTRREVFRRDHNTCQYCGRHTTELTIDHVIPRDRSGQSTWDNLVACCLKCNNKKGNRTPREAQMALLREPHRPRYVALALLGEPTHREVWSKYLF